MLKKKSKSFKLALGAKTQLKFLRITFSASAMRFEPQKWITERETSFASSHLQTPHSGNLYGPSSNVTAICNFI